MIAARIGAFSCGQSRPPPERGHGQEVGAEEHPRDAAKREDRRRQRRGRGLVGVAELARALAEHVAAGQELQDVGIGGGFGLDEHGRPRSSWLRWPLRGPGASAQRRPRDGQALGAPSEICGGDVEAGLHRPRRAGRPGSWSCSPPSTSGSFRPRQHQVQAARAEDHLAMRRDDHRRRPRPSWRHAACISSVWWMPTAGRAGAARPRQQRSGCVAGVGDDHIGGAVRASRRSEARTMRLETVMSPAVT